MNQYPLPNYVDPDAAGTYELELQGFRVLTRIRSGRRSGGWTINQSRRLRFYDRGVNNIDEQANYYGNWPSGSTNFKLVQVKYGLPGYGHVGSVTWTISPTFVSETTFGMDQNGIDLDSLQPEAIERTKWGNLPKWYTFESKDGVTDPTLLPDIPFGGQPANTPVVTVGGHLPWKNISRNYDFTAQRDEDHRRPPDQVRRVRGVRPEERSHAVELPREPTTSAATP